ncbi:MAG: hypothetical protein IKT14_00690 [Clostridiales bacterium]|nr:hypothetical protein [Clostridiales bacterium]MBR6483509.1 hypothetical protein [Clostridiales bacterium]
MSPFEMSVVGFFLIVAVKAAHEAYLFWKEEEEIYEYAKRLSAVRKPRPIKRRADVRPLPVRKPPEDLPRAA